MAEGTGRKATQSEYEWQIRGFVLLSFILQVLLYFLPPLRNTTSSKWHLRLTSMVFYLSTWIPTFTLTFICSYAIHSSGDRGDYYPPLLTWAALMLLHLEGHGQERETPYSLQMSDLPKEFFQILLKFVLHDVILFGMLYLFQLGKEMPSLYPPFLMLACMRTLSKLKHLSNQTKEMKELSKPIQLKQSDERAITGIAHDLVQVPLKLFWFHRLSEQEQIASSNVFNRFTPSEVIRIIEVELNLIYNKFYGGVLPSMFELVVVFLLPAFKAHSITSFHAYISPLVHLFIITLLSTLFKPKFSLPILLLSWYVHMYLKITSIHPQVQYRSQEFEILVDGYIIDATALICTHQLVVHLWLMKQRCLSYQGNGRQPHTANLMDNYLWQPLLDHGKDRLTKRHGWCRIVPRFNLLVYTLRKPRKVFLLETLPVSSREFCTEINNIGEFILNELNMSYHDPENVRKLISFRGLYIPHPSCRYKLVGDIRAPFEDIVLRWHLATGILYHVDNTSTRTRTSTSTSSSSSSSSGSNRDRSMLLSDYMGYLLMIHPRIMCKKRGGTFRKSQDALLEIIEQQLKLSAIGGDHQSWTEERQLQEICLGMQSFSNTERQPQADYESASQTLDSLKTFVKEIQSLRDSWSKKLLFPLPRLPLQPSKSKEKDHIRRFAQSLSEIEASLSKKLQILSLRDSKEEQQLPLPQEKDVNDQTTSKKQPVQGLRKEDRIIQMEKLIEDVEKVVQVFLEILPILSTLTQDLQDFRSRQFSPIKTKALVFDVNSKLHDIVKAIDPLSKIDQSFRRVMNFLRDKKYEQTEISSTSKLLLTLRTLNFGEVLSSLRGIKRCLERPSIQPPLKDSMVDGACDLAAEIKSKFPDPKTMWEIISKAWVAMLAHACINSDPMDHFQGLSQGGELATVVWLSMLHLGFIQEQHRPVCDPPPRDLGFQK